MNPGQMWMWICLLFFSWQSQGDACSWMTSHYSMKSRESLRLLRDMGGYIPPVNGPFPFPHALYRNIEKAKVEDQVSFLAVATEEIIELFNQPLSSSTLMMMGWNNQDLDHFLSILHDRQMKNLKQCVKIYQATSGKSFTEKSLKKYFRKLRRILKKHNYSADSWEYLRRVVSSHVQRMDIIAADVKHKLSNNKKVN